ncbi:hypothetical protein ACFE04_013584 [Oxalis oulophora]
MVGSIQTKPGGKPKMGELMAYARALVAGFEPESIGGLISFADTFDRLATLLAKERSNPHTYIGCMKKGHIITDPKLKWYVASDVSGGASSPAWPANLGSLDAKASSLSCLSSQTPWTSLITSVGGSALGYRKRQFVKALRNIQAI